MRTRRFGDSVPDTPHCLILLRHIKLTSADDASAWAKKRLKYGVVGSHVNLTSRIQSFTVGGQILVSETTRREVGRILKTGKQIEVRAKGFEHPVTLSEVLGIGGSHKLMLYQSSDTLTELTDAILLTCLVLEGGLQSDETFKGSFTRLGSKQAEGRFEKAVPVLSNLKLRLIDEAGYDVPGALYGKVVSIGAGGKSEVLIHFTSMSREIEAFLSKWQKKSGDDTPMPSPIVPTNELAAEQTTLQ